MQTFFYASQGGRAYHADSECSAFFRGQELWRFDPDVWVPGMPQIMLSNGHPLVRMDIYTALGQGKLPCVVCVPGSRSSYFRTHSESDFGHEPVEYDGVPICRSCHTTVTHYDEAYQPSRYLRPVPWPCMSAVVLGLVPYEKERVA